MATWAILANIATTVGVIASIFFGVRAERATVRRSEAAAPTIDRSDSRAGRPRGGTRWHAALTNPLLASVAVLVLSARPGASDRLLSRTTLFSAWVELLAEEASAALDLPQATIRRVIDALAEAGGECRVVDLASATRLHSDRVDSIVHQLADDGLLEMSSSARDTARFRWEALNDMLQMRHAIRAGRLDSLLSVSDEDRRLALSSLAAELVPKENPSQELPDLKLSALSVEECNQMFALSLGSRGDDEITPRARQLAARLLDSGGEVSETIVGSVLGMPDREELGAPWLNELLRVRPLHRRTRFWPQALEGLSEGSQFDQKNLESLLGWYVTDYWKELSGEAAEYAVELLAWMGCAATETGLPEFAICSLVEILHGHPETFEVVMERLTPVEDDHPRDALFTAAAGVVARWPGSAAAAIMRDSCSRALDRTPGPQSFRSLAAIHTAIGSSQPMHQFLEESLPPLTARRPLRLFPLVDDDDRGMFADGRGPHEATVFESRILASLNISRKHYRLLLEGDRIDSRYGHVSSLVFGRWLARQYAQHRTGARLFSMHEGAIKAGTAENPAGGLLEHPDDAWDFFVDPTVPLALVLRAADTVYPDTWWALHAAPAAGSAADLRVTAPRGVTWIVIDGRFRLLAPTPVASGRPTLRLGRSHWSLADEDDGRPLPGRARHVVMHIVDATLAPRTVVRPEQEPHPRRRTRFADSFALPSEDGEMVRTRLDGEVNPPSADALELLNARWTGEGLDCVDPAGELVITDPAVGLDSPHALLVREDALISALERTGQQLTIHLTAVNNLIHPLNNSETYTVVLGGS